MQTVIQAPLVSPLFAYQPKMRAYQIVDKWWKLIKLVRQMWTLQEFAFDTETNTLKVHGPNNNFSLVGVSISWGEYNNYYIPIGHMRAEDYDRQLDLDYIVERIKPVFEREDVRIIGHNLKFDMHTLSRVGIFIKTKDIFDTMIASWLCNENSPNGLKENSLYFLNIEQTHFQEVTALVPNDVKKEFGLKSNSKVTFDLVLIDDGAPYALADAYYTWELYLGYILMLEDEKMDKVFYKVYMPFIYTLYNMEERGATIDRKHLKQMDEDITKDLEDLQYQMYEIAGIEFNPSSNGQLSELLFGYEAESKPVNLDKQPKIVQKMYEEEDEEGLAKRGLYIRYNDFCSYVSKEGLYKRTGNPEILAVSFNFKPVSTTPKGAPQTNSEVFWQLSKKTFKNKRKQEGVELCKLLIEYKKLSKLKSAFIDGFDEQMYDDGKVHPSFNIIGTDSGRISCSQPNLQQLPKADEEDKYQIRSLFIGSKDPVTNSNKKIVALDFANLEMRVLAHFSEDKNLLSMFANDEDTHGSTAVNMFELPCDASEVKQLYPHLRQAAKVLNFLLMYGGGASTLYENLKNDHFSPVDLGEQSYLDTYNAKNGEEVAQAYIDKYFSTYSGVSKFIKNQKRYAHKNGFVYTLLKRKRRLPDINSRDYKNVAYCERLSVNSAVQGSAADITMSAQNRVNADPWFYAHRVYMIVQVHDELVFECPEEYVDECIKRAKFLMEHPFGDDVKLNLDLRADADSGDSYQEAK